MSRFFESAVLKMLDGLRGGKLTVVTPTGGVLRFGDGGSDLEGEIEIHNERFYQRLITGGKDEAGDSFMDGDWSSRDLVPVVRLAIRNLERINSMGSFLGLGSKLMSYLGRFANRNTIEGSKRNIHAHYDLGNEFFRLFLDESMLYSAAFFETTETSLEAAQTEKIDRICRKLALNSSDRVLEIGSGWGAFALHAVTRYGCRVTTTTISEEQYDLCETRFAAAAAGNRIELLLEDYRKLKGRYDKIVSIEMFEAIGFDHYDDYFDVCNRLLNPDGVMALQAITMNEKSFPNYVRTSDWIQRRIFPGGQLASVQQILASLARTSGMGLFHLEDLGIHYALTLQEWNRRWRLAKEKARAMGFDESFIRMWDFYLGYCEAAFRERYISDVQIVLTKGNRDRVIPGDPVPVYAEGAAV